MSNLRNHLDDSNLRDVDRQTLEAVLVRAGFSLDHPLTDLEVVASIVDDPEFISCTNMAQRASFKKIFPKSNERIRHGGNLRHYSHGTVGNLLQNGASLDGSIINLCTAPLASPSTLYASDLYEPLLALHRDGDYMNWRIDHLRNVTEVLAGKLVVQANGHVEGVTLYDWYGDQLEKMFAEYPKTHDVFDPSYVLINFNVPIGGALPALPAFPPAPTNQWAAPVAVDNRPDLFAFPGVPASIQRESRAAFVAIVVTALPLATFLVFECNRAPIAYVS